jgi:hypothetical protein
MRIENSSILFPFSYFSLKFMRYYFLSNLYMILLSSFLFVHNFISEKLEMEVLVNSNA